MLSVGAVRTTALVVCVAGIAGMIVTSILDHNGAAVTFGLVSAVAVVCSMVAKAVTADAGRHVGAPGASGHAPSVSPGPGVADLDALADLVERQVQAVVAAGVEEATVRQLVGEAVRLGRALALSRAAEAMTDPN